MTPPSRHGPITPAPGSKFPGLKPESERSAGRAPGGPAVPSSRIGLSERVTGSESCRPPPRTLITS
eukprot:338560-Hanusia_phi.AAC.1